MLFVNAYMSTYDLESWKRNAKHCSFRDTHGHTHWDNHITVFISESERVNSPFLSVTRSDCVSLQYLCSLFNNECHDCNAYQY